MGANAKNGAGGARKGNRGADATCNFSSLRSSGKTRVGSDEKRRSSGCPIPLLVSAMFVLAIAAPVMIAAEPVGMSSPGLRRRLEPGASESTAMRLMEQDGMPMGQELRDGNTSATAQQARKLAQTGGCWVRLTSKLDAPPALHLAGMQLFNKDGVQIPKSSITATLSTVLQPFTVDRCNPGRSEAAGNPDFCHTALEDKDPSVTFRYPCSEGLSRVNVANKKDLGCPDQAGWNCATPLNSYSLDWMKDGVVQKTFQFTDGRPTYTFDITGCWVKVRLTSQEVLAMADDEVPVDLHGEQHTSEAATTVAMPSVAAVLHNDSSPGGSDPAIEVQNSFSSINPGGPKDEYYVQMESMVFYAVVAGANKDECVNVWAMNLSGDNPRNGQPMLNYHMGTTWKLKLNGYRWSATMAVKRGTCTNQSENPPIELSDAGHICYAGTSSNGRLKVPNQCLDTNMVSKGAMTWDKYTGPNQEYTITCKKFNKANWDANINREKAMLEPYKFVQECKIARKDNGWYIGIGGWPGQLPLLDPSKGGCWMDGHVWDLCKVM